MRALEIEVKKASCACGLHSSIEEDGDDVSSRRIGL